MNNAKYALSMARRIGAPVYALPEDLYEVIFLIFFSKQSIFFHYFFISGETQNDHDCVCKSNVGGYVLISLHDFYFLQSGILYFTTELFTKLFLLEKCFKCSKNIFFFYFE